MKNELIIDPEKMEVLDKAITTYGIRNQIDIAIEEMSELTKALCKLKRYSSGEAWDYRQLDNVSEEMADVQIMIVQLIAIFQNNSDVQRMMNHKIVRLESRLNSRKEEPDHG